MKPIDCSLTFLPFRSCSGAWILCDGGYHRWRATIAGYKHSANDESVAWSKRQVNLLNCIHASIHPCHAICMFVIETSLHYRMTSIRKDVEDCFGTLKRRFRILRIPIMFKYEKHITNAFKTCCILHNMLLDWDDLGITGQEDEHWISQDGADLAAMLEDIKKRREAVKRRRNPSYQPSRSPLHVSNIWPLNTLAPMQLRHRFYLCVQQLYRQVTYSAGNQLPMSIGDDFGRTGGLTNEEPVQKENGYEAMRVKLVAHYLWLVKTRGVLWLRSGIVQ